MSERNSHKSIRFSKLPFITSLVTTKFDFFFSILFIINKPVGLFVQCYLVFNTFLLCFVEQVLYRYQYQNVIILKNLFGAHFQQLAGRIASIECQESATLLLDVTECLFGRIVGRNRWTFVFCLWELIVPFYELNHYWYTWCCSHYLGVPAYCISSIEFIKWFLFLAKKYQHR